MTVSPYSSLRQQVVLGVGASAKHGQIVQSLKEFYKDDIDSPRRFEQIKTIGQLLNVLEIRDVLSEDDVGSLKEIARKLNNNASLLKTIKDYETVHQNSKNSFALEQHNSSHREHIVPHSNNLPNNNTNERKKQIITEAVIADIGSYWVDLARNLEIKECIIDEIDNKNDYLSNKASLMMEVYFETIKTTDPQRWFYNLCNALERTRRRDLSKLIQKIMTV